MPTLKQIKFVQFLPYTETVTDAARSAGYSSPGSAAWYNLEKVSLMQIIESYDFGQKHRLNLIMKIERMINAEKVYPYIKGRKYPDHVHRLKGLRLGNNVMGYYP